MSNILKFVISFFQYWHFLNNKQVPCDLLSVPRGVEAHLSLQKRYKAHNTHKSLFLHIQRQDRFLLVANLQICAKPIFFISAFKVLTAGHCCQRCATFFLLLLAYFLDSKGPEWFLYVCAFLDANQSWLSTFFYMWLLDSDTWIYLEPNICIY